MSAAAAADQHHGLDGANDGARDLGVTIYGCEDDESSLFRELASRMRIKLIVTDEEVSEATAALAFGNRCISVGHKTQISDSTLVSLHRAGVEYISTRSIGHNHIDMRCAERLGIFVETTCYSPDSVADYTLMLMLMVLRHARSTLSRADRHNYELHEARGKELRDLTVGVIGTGRIGLAVIERLRGFGGLVLAHDRCPRAAVEYVPLEEVLRRSDVITLHTPLNADTCHLLNRRRIEQMRRGAIVINTGRGALLDTEALLAALESGRLGGAALDVLEGEEGYFYSDYSQRSIGHRQLLRLQQLPNVIITPHTAYYTDHALVDTVENTLMNCLRFEGRVA
jgi:D-specific alpha-keto acid dehydrogenase